MDEFVGELPKHPSEGHKKANGEPTCVLPSTVAAAVLTDLELPNNPDRGVVYIRSAQSVSQTSPFVHAVWFAPETVDGITARPAGAHARSTRELREAWLAAAEKHGSGGTKNQPAGGVYAELGVGTMAGRGRTSLSIGGKGTHIPYSRNACMSSALEPALSSFLSDVSEVLHATLPEGTLQDHEVDGRCPAEASRCYQYPKLRPGVEPLSSHQVAIRGPRGRASMHESDREAYMSTSDLHLDPCDGGGRIGSCTIHTCHPNTPDAPWAAATESREQLRLRGLAVFPSRTGGRGVHIKSMAPGWHCAILMQTGERLHGSVQPNAHEVIGFGLTHLQLMRVVTYPLTAVERLLERLAEEPQMWPVLLAHSDEWIQRRVSCLNR